MTPALWTSAIGIARTRTGGRGIARTWRLHRTRSIAAAIDIAIAIAILWAAREPLAALGFKVVFDEHGPTRVDAAEIRARASEQAQRLFVRMEEL